jgi:hypothetical protein
MAFGVLTLTLIGGALAAASAAPVYGQAVNRAPAPAGTTGVASSVRTVIAVPTATSTPAGTVRVGTAADTGRVAQPHMLDPTATPIDPTPTPFLSPGGPDLKIEFAGYVDSYTVAVAVTNIGGVRAAAVTATVEKVAPPSAVGGLREFYLPALNPGQSFNFTYDLGPSPCPAGLTLHAAVLPGVDSDRSNNDITQTVCANPNILAQPSQPERSPGQHTLDISPDYYTAAWIHVDGCTTSAPPLAPGTTTLAGWWQPPCTDIDVDRRGNIRYDEKVDSWAFQSGVHFDLTQLDQIPAKTVTSASLTFDEARFRWTDAEGNDRDAPGCISTLGLPTTDWLTIPHGSLIPNTTVADFSPWPSDRQDFSGTTFDVTGPVQSMLQQHRNSDQRFAVMPQDGQLIFPNSFVLRGANEGLQGDDESSCLSAVSNARLHVTFVVS